MPLASPQTAEDLFGAVAGLNAEGVVESFSAALARARRHLVDAVRCAAPGGTHGDLCYHLHVGASLLFALLDGLAVFVEKKLAQPPTGGRIYWAGAATFLDPRFGRLRAIQERTASYALRGGITADTLRNFAKHYLPWIHLTSMGRDGSWDARFPIGDDGSASGPLLHGLLFPIFDDACEACRELAHLCGVPCPQLPMQLAAP